MAIQKSITDQFGSAHTASYTRILRIVLNEAHVEISVGIHHDATARSKGNVASVKQMLEVGVMQIKGSDFDTFFQDSVLDNNATSPLKQAYACLKTQNDFMYQNWTTGTTDV